MGPSSSWRTPHALTLGVLFSIGVASGVVFGGLAAPWHPLWHLLHNFGAPARALWVLTGLATITAAVLSFHNATWIFEHRYHLVAALVVSLGAINGINFGRLDIFDVVFLPIAAFWFATSVVEQRPQRTPWPVLVFMGLIAIAAVDSIVNGRDVSIFSLHTILAKLALAFFTANLLVSLEVQRATLRIFLVMATGTAVLALAFTAIHFFTGFEISFVDAASERYKFTPFGKLLRATGFTQSPQTLGHYLLIALAVTLVTPVRKWIAGLFAVLYLAAIAATLSMGAITVAAVIVVAAPILRSPAYMLHYFIGYVLAGCALFFSGLGHIAYDKIIDPMTAVGVSRRLELARGGIEGILAHPYLGAGIMNFGRELKLPVHNAYLQATFEIGLLGGLAYIALLVYLLANLIVLTLKADDDQDRRWLAAITLGQMAVMLHLSFEPLFLHVVPWIYFGIATATIQIYRDKRMKEYFA